MAFHSILSGRLGSVPHSGRSMAPPDRIHGRARLWASRVGRFIMAVPERPWRAGDLLPGLQDCSQNRRAAAAAELPEAQIGRRT
jgi:hypothetical protein